VRGVADRTRSAARLPLPGVTHVSGRLPGSEPGRAGCARGRWPRA
jgi:hypothetical protein